MNKADDGEARFLEKKISAALALCFIYPSVLTRVKRRHAETGQGGLCGDFIHEFRAGIGGDKVVSQARRTLT